MAEIIKSRENPRIKQLCRLLSSKKDREEAGQFVCEGARLSLDACRSDVEIVELFLSESACERYLDAISELKERACKTLIIDNNLAERIGDTKSSQGIFALCKGLDNRGSIVTIRKGGNYILLCGLQDPGNLGAILRTAEALGIDGVFLDGGCPELYSPKTLRASMGGVFRLAVEKSADMPDTVARLKAEGIPVWAAALDGNSVTLDEDTFNGGGSVMIGNEGNGLFPEMTALCDRTLQIPMPGGAESLNAAAAAAILLWEMTRQNRR